MLTWEGKTKSTTKMPTSLGSSGKEDFYCVQDGPVISWAPSLNRLHEVGSGLGWGQWATGHRCKLLKSTQKLRNQDKSYSDAIYLKTKMNTENFMVNKIQFSSVQSLSRDRLFSTPWTKDQHFKQRWYPAHSTCRSLRVSASLFP